MKSQNNRISICVPVYNVEAYIEVCLHSIFKQTYTDIEYLFINDCTPDNSINVINQIIELYPQRKKQVRIINHDNNKGLSAARNTAIENATGRFIFHVDSDDYIEPDAIEKLVKKQIETNADLVVANYLIESSRKTSHVKYLDINKTKQELICDSLNEKCSHSIWGILIKKTIYTENNIKAKQGVNVGEDWQVASQILYYAKKIAYVDTITYHYLMSRPGSYTIESFESSKKKKEHVMQFVKTQQYLLDCFKNKEKIYTDIINRKLVTLSQDAMIYSAKDNDKKSFYEMVKILESVNPMYYNVLGKKNFLDIAFKKNYYIMKCILWIKYMTKH